MWRRTRRACLRCRLGRLFYRPRARRRCGARRSGFGCICGLIRTCLLAMWPILWRHGHGSNKGPPLWPRTGWRSWRRWSVWPRDVPIRPPCLDAREATGSWPSCSPDKEASGRGWAAPSTMRSRSSARRSMRFVPISTGTSSGRCAISCSLGRLRTGGAARSDGLHPAGAVCVRGRVVPAVGELRPQAGPSARSLDRRVHDRGLERRRSRPRAPRRTIAAHFRSGLGAARCGSPPT